MSPRIWLFVAALLGAISVGLGAFGAHGLPSYLAGQGLSPEEVARRMLNWETAARYQMYHALAILAVVASAKSLSPLINAANWSWLLGTLIFSGLLYAFVLSAVKAFGAGVPIGGVLLIIGWLLLAVAALRQ